MSDKPKDLSSGRGAETAGRGARPILFSAPMIRALLYGRKTQTRRVMKPQPIGFWGKLTEDCIIPGVIEGPRDHFWRCPYGKPGDLLWVREAICIGYDLGDGSATAIPFDGCEKFRKAFYRATDDDKPDEAKRPWRPSIHMPRWASRLTLRITGVRVQRIETISQDDAVAEGPPCWICGGRVDGLSENECGCFHSRTEAGPSFAHLWDSINGAGSFDSSPWVWALGFEVIKANIGTVSTAAQASTDLMNHDFKEQK